MSTIAKSSSVLFRLRARDSLNGVSRDTLKKLAAYFDVSDTQVMHYALRRLATEVLPAYEADDGPLSDEVIAMIRAMEPQEETGIVLSSLID